MGRRKDKEKGFCRPTPTLSLFCTIENSAQHEVEVEKPVLEPEPLEEKGPENGVPENALKVEETLALEAGKQNEGVQELYYDVEEIPMELELLEILPDIDDLLFDLTCAKCWEYSGEPTISCKDGHAICRSCYKAGVKKCPAEIQDRPTTTFTCGEGLYGVNDAIRNTPYYKLFMKNAMYSCSLKELGCDAVLSEDKIHEHDCEKCPFLFIKYCRFRTTHGCKAVFDNLADNVSHLLRDHSDLTKVCQAEHTYSIRCDWNLAGTGVVVTSAIKAVVQPKNESCRCVLIVQNLKEEGIARVYFVQDGVSQRLRARIRFFKIGDEDENSEVEPIVANLAVVPNVKLLNDLSKPEDGYPYYLDISHRMIDERFCLESDGEKRFGLMVILGKTEK